MTRITSVQHGGKKYKIVCKLGRFLKYQGGDVPAD